MAVAQTFAFDKHGDDAHTLLQQASCALQQQQKQHQVRAFA
jgi:hypothetical protein